jgi:hypothetical protein
LVWVWGKESVGLETKLNSTPSLQVHPEQGKVPWSVASVRCAAWRSRGRREHVVGPHGRGLSVVYSCLSINQATVF